MLRQLPISSSAPVRRVSHAFAGGNYVDAARGGCFDSTGCTAHSLSALAPAATCVGADLGPWYEIADSASFKELFEKGLQCTVANYTLQGSGNGTYVEVDNYGRYDSPTGPIKRAIGKALQVSGAKLKVKFPGAPVYAPYWIVDLLGDASTGFSVSLVWSCSSVLGVFTFSNMWVLSRTPQLPAGVTLDDLYAKATALGIDVASLKMTPTAQPPTCLYG